MGFRVLILGWLFVAGQCYCGILFDVFSLQPAVIGQGGRGSTSLYSKNCG
jgi:hypothetical protein